MKTISPEDNDVSMYTLT